MQHISVTLRADRNTFVQGDQKIFVQLMITIPKTRKNILNRLIHLPW
jgi:hypothetical protein